MKKALVGTLAAVALAGSGLVASVGTASAAAGPTSAGPTSVLACRYSTASPTISKGSVGAAVRQAQCLLSRWDFFDNRHGFPGVFDDNTESAVKAFQSSYCDLDEYGVVGPNTWRALRTDVC